MDLTHNAWVIHTSDCMNFVHNTFSIMGLFAKRFNIIKYLWVIFVNNVLNVGYNKMSYWTANLGIRYLQFQVSTTLTQCKFFQLHWIPCIIYLASCRAASTEKNLWYKLTQKHESGCCLQINPNYLVKLTLTKLKLGQLPSLLKSTDIEISI